MLIKIKLVYGVLGGHDRNSSTATTFQTTQLAMNKILVFATFSLRRSCWCRDSEIITCSLVSQTVKLILFRSLSIQSQCIVCVQVCLLLLYILATRFCPSLVTSAVKDETSLAIRRSCDCQWWKARVTIQFLQKTTIITCKESRSILKYMLCIVCVRLNFLFSLTIWSWRYTSSTSTADGD